MKLLVKKGATSYQTAIFIQDSSSTTGAGLTGLVFNTSSLVCYRARSDDGNAGGTAITLATATLGTWASGGFKEKDATNMPGVYEFGIPNNAIATGSNWCVIMLKGATNMAPLALEIQLVDFDPQDSVHLGLTCLPNTAVTTNASLLTSGTGTDQISVSTGRVDITKILGTTISTPATAGILDVNVKNMNNVAATSITTINANIGSTQPINFTGTAGSALVKSDMVDVAGAAVSTSSAQIGVNVVNAGGTAWASGALTSGVFASGAINNAAFNADTGKKTVRSNTAAAGANGTITLDASASSTDNFYKGAWIYLTGGTGVGQTRLCTGYVGSTQVATITPNWATNPDNTSTYAILPTGGVDAELLNYQAITAAAGVTFPASVASPTNITAGTITTVTNLTNAPTSGDLTATMKTSVTTAATAATPTAAAVTGDVGGNVVGTVGSVVTKTGYALTSAYDFAKGTVAMTESYAANGAAPTPAQAFFAIHQMLMDFGISGTNITVKKLDNSTTAFIVAIDSSTAPTAASRT